MLECHSHLCPIAAHVNAKPRQSHCSFLLVASWVLGLPETFHGDTPQVWRTERKHPLTSPSPATCPPHTRGWESPPVQTTRATFGEQRGKGLSLHQALAVHLPVSCTLGRGSDFGQEKKKKRLMLALLQSLACPITWPFYPKAHIFHDVLQ